MINPHIPPGIHPELKAHTQLFKKKVYKIGDNVYSAVGWAPANTIMIEGEDGIILVDVGREIESAKEVKKEFSKITHKPIKAIILTHFHPDHIHGMKAWISGDTRFDVEEISGSMPSLVQIRLYGVSGRSQSNQTGWSHPDGQG